MRTAGVVGFVGVGLTVVIGGVLVAGAVLPRDYAVQRSLLVEAAPETVFEQVIELRAHEAWSPWKAADDTMVFSYGEASRGPGAVYTWTSQDSGDGQYTITAAEPPSRIDTHIVFEGMGESDGWWTFEPEGEGTRVTWGFAGRTDGMMGGLFAALMDPMVGPSFEDGLSRLKAAAETAPPPPPVLGEGRHRGILTLSTDGATFRACGEDVDRTVQDDLGEALAPFRARAAEAPLSVYVEVEGGPHDDGPGLHARALILATLEQPRALCAQPLPEGHVMAGGEGGDGPWSATVLDGTLRIEGLGDAPVVIEDLEVDGTRWEGMLDEDTPVVLAVSEAPCTHADGQMVCAWSAELSWGNATLSGCARVGWGDGALQAP